MKIGRNDPCLCGSGIKYKKCCAGKQETGGQPPGMGGVMGELRELLKGQSFASLDEANAFLRQHISAATMKPLAARPGNTCRGGHDNRHEFA